MKRAIAEAIMASGVTQFCQPMPSITETRRVQESWTAPAEKQALLWLAARTPEWIGPDHLTLLGLVAQIGAGLCYGLARQNQILLLGVILCLALNWLGDSLDGTLARVRQRQRPRYGFYVDHMVDSFAPSPSWAGWPSPGTCIPGSRSVCSSPS